jgi:hypothetical protein
MGRSPTVVAYVGKIAVVPYSGGSRVLCMAFCMDVRYRREYPSVSAILLFLSYSLFIQDSLSTVPGRCGLYSL